MDNYQINQLSNQIKIYEPNKYKIELTEQQKKYDDHIKKLLDHYKTANTHIN